MQRKLSMLQNLPIFGGIREDIIKLILDLSSTAAAAKGEFYFRENDSANSIFVVETGVVAILKKWQDQQIFLSHIFPGDCMGEMALVDLLPRSASAYAEEDSRSIEISAETLFEVYKKDLEQFTIIQMNICREICRRLREMDKQLFEHKIKAEIKAGNIRYHPLDHSTH